VAAIKGSLRILQVWEWAKEKLTTYEINYELLLGIDNKGWTAWHMAAIRGNLEILQHKEVAFRQPITHYHILCCYQVSRLGLVEWTVTEGGRVERESLVGISKLEADFFKYTIGILHSVPY
jgi:hypothetical protein